MSKPDPFIITAIRLTDTWLAKPVNQLGNIGWYPMAWAGVTGDTEQQAIDNFLLCHSEWENSHKMFWQNKTFTGYLILEAKLGEPYKFEGDHKVLYQSVDGTAAELTYAGIKVVRDRDFPGHRIAKFAQAVDGPTIHRLVAEEESME